MRYLFALLLAGPAFAQTYALRPEDRPFDAAALEARLSGQVLTFFDDGQSRYFADGRYTYTYAGAGGTAHGYWRTTDKGEVCVDFVNGFSRCDLYVMNDARLLLLDDKGARFPVRP